MLRQEFFGGNLRFVCAVLSKAAFRSIEFATRFAESRNPMQRKPELLTFIVKHVTSSARHAIKLAQLVLKYKVCNLIIESLRSAPIKVSQLICKMQISKL